MNRYVFIGGALLLFLVGFVFLRGPVPHIAIAAEELFSVGPVKVTNTMFTSWVTILMILFFVVFATRRAWTLVPSGVQNFVEAVVEAFYNLVIGVAGEENGRRFFPLVATIFFFIAISNWFSLTPIFNSIRFQHEAEHGLVAEQTEAGPLDIAYVPFSSPGSLSADTIDEDDADAHERAEEARHEGKFVGEFIPLFRGINTDLNTPLAIAVIAVITVQFWGVQSLGFFTYAGKFINFRGPVDFFVGFLELISEIVRLVSFTFRLFGNMFAGEVVILMFTFLTPLLLTLPFYGLELFVGVIQAFIFAMLTLVFAVMAVSAHGDDHETHAMPASDEGTIEESLHDAIYEPSNP